VRKLKDENYELKQKLGQTSNSLPRLKTQNNDSGKHLFCEKEKSRLFLGSQTSIRSAGSMNGNERQDPQ
jgi:hypothetical protein